MLKVPDIIVDCNWLKEHLDSNDLIVLDATIPKVTANKKQQIAYNERIPFSRFFDVKQQFSDKNAVLPNTMLPSDEFQTQAQKLGIHQDSCLVIYDQLGIYSSPRVWWMFKSMGFDNVAVLNGGLPEWKRMGFDVVQKEDINFEKGDFVANQKESSFVDYKTVLTTLKDQQYQILDARSSGRFKGEAPEPREGVKSGHIPTSRSLPYVSLLDGNKLQSKENLIELFRMSNEDQKPMIFSCGTGITACVLALGATISGFKDIQVYDGSWTEWGSLPDAPIEV